MRPTAIQGGQNYVQSADDPRRDIIGGLIMANRHRLRESDIPSKARCLLQELACGAHEGGKHRCLDHLLYTQGVRV